VRTAPPDAAASELPGASQLLAEPGLPAEHPGPPQPPGTRPSLGHGLSFAAVGTVLAVLLALGNAVVSARLYGVRVVGEYALVLAPYLLLIQLSTVSEQVGLVRRLAGLPPRDPRATGLVAAVLAFSGLLTVVMAGVVVALDVAVLRGAVGQPGLLLPGLVVLAGYVVFDNTSWNLDTVLASHGAARSLAVARTATAAALLAVSVVATAATRSVWGLVVATVASFAVGLAVRLVLLRPLLTWRCSAADLRAGRRELPAMLRFGVQLLPGQLAQGVVMQSMTWVLGGVRGLVELGAFARAGSLAHRLQEAGYRVAEILFPVLVRHRDADDAPAFAGAMSQALRHTGAALLLFASVGGGAAAAVLGVLFGPGFTGGANALTLLLLAYSLSVLAMVQGAALIASGRPRASSVWVLVRAAITLPLLVPAAHLAGGAGVAAAVCIGYAVELAGKSVRERHGALRGVLGGAGDRRSLLAVVAAAAAGFAAARVAVDARLPLPAPVALVVALTLGTLAYAGVFLLLGGLSPTERAGMRARLRGGRERHP